MKLATDVVKLPSTHNSGSYKYPTLEEAWQFFFSDIPYKEAHRGLDDAIHEAKIVYELYQRGIFSM